jgi:hypothetical protein
VAIARGSRAAGGVGCPPHRRELIAHTMQTAKRRKRSEMPAKNAA